MISRKNISASGSKSQIGGLSQSTNDINTNVYWCVREYPTIFVDPCGVIFECAAAVDAASANLLSLQLKFYRRGSFRGPLGSAVSFSHVQQLQGLAAMPSGVDLIVLQQLS